MTDDSSSSRQAAEIARGVRQQLSVLKGWGIEALPIQPRQPVAPPAVRPPGSKSGAPKPESEAMRTKREALARIGKEIAACTRCPLARTRTHPVPGEGDPDAKLVFVGEAPGREEDLQGRPFVGAAGQLLTRMIEAMGLARERVYICNVLKDRPPDNRTPVPEEITACLPFLVSQLETIRPQVICALGAVAAKALLGSPVSIVEVRGRRFEFHGIPLIPTFHPAYLLRNPSAKKLAWEDLKKVKKLLTE